MTNCWIHTVPPPLPWVVVSATVDGCFSNSRRCVMGAARGWRGGSQSSLGARSSASTSLSTNRALRVTPLRRKKLSFRNAASPRPASPQSSPSPRRVRRTGCHRSCSPSPLGVHGGALAQARRWATRRRRRRQQLRRRRPSSSELSSSSRPSASALQAGEMECHPAWA